MLTGSIHPIILSSLVVLSWQLEKRSALEHTVASIVIKTLTQRIIEPDRAIKTSMQLMKILEAFIFVKFVSITSSKFIINQNDRQVDSDIML